MEKQSSGRACCVRLSVRAGRSPNYPVNWYVQQEDSPNWDTLSQHLDEAMNDLAEADREAVLLRYFQDRNFRQVGLQLGLSEEAARKRVERAIEKLRMAFSRRGVQTSSAAMAAAIAGQSLIPIPHALGAVICQTAAASASSKAIGVITLMTIPKSFGQMLVWTRRKQRFRPHSGPPNRERSAAWLKR